MACFRDHAIDGHTCNTYVNNCSKKWLNAKRHNVFQRKNRIVLYITSIVEEIHYPCTVTCWGLLLKTLLFTVSSQNKSVIIISLMLLAYSGKSSVVFSCHLYSALLFHLTWCYRYDYRGIDNHTGHNWCSAWQLQVLDTSEDFALGSPVVSLHSNPWTSHHNAITL